MRAPYRSRSISAHPLAAALSLILFHETGLYSFHMKVRDIIKRLEQDGWQQVAQRGSHRQFKHATKPGKVTVNGHPGDDVHGALLQSIWKQAGLE